MQEQGGQRRHEPGDPGMTWEPFPDPPAEVAPPEVAVPAGEEFAALARSLGLGDLEHLGDDQTP